VIIRSSRVSLMSHRPRILPESYVPRVGVSSPSSKKMNEWERMDSSSLTRATNDSIMGAQPRMITLAEVEQHVTYDDLWLVIDGKVYDVTPFMDDHPGGGEIMLNAAGKDGTDDFEDVGHSPGAREQLKKYEIGVYAGGESAKPSGTKGKSGSMTTRGGGAAATVLLPVLVVLLALLAAVLGAK
jgi:cytochrome b involved in lipid metabolism